MANEQQVIQDVITKIFAAAKMLPIHSARNEEEDEPVRVVSENGDVMMSVSTIGSDGKRLVIDGSLVGSWPAKMYVDLEDVQRMTKLVMNPELISYILCMPIWTIRRKLGKE